MIRRTILWAGAGAILALAGSAQIAAAAPLAHDALAGRIAPTSLLQQAHYDDDYGRERRRWWWRQREDDRGWSWRHRWEREHNRRFDRRSDRDDDRRHDRDRRW